MPTLSVVTEIQAPIELCFDLSRDIDLHIRSTAGTNEKAVAGITGGLIGPHEEVTWEATHFGIRQTLTSRMTAFDRPYHFRDTEVRGTFKRFDHNHFFSAHGRKTIMQDIFDFESPWGVLGKTVNSLFLNRYMYRFIARRAAAIKAEAEKQVMLGC